MCLWLHGLYPKSKRNPRNFLLPPVEGLLGDPHLPADLQDRGASFGLPEAFMLADPAQIHQLNRKRYPVGTGGEAGYDGKGSTKTITNEVQLLWPKEHCLSSTPRRRVPRG